MPPMSSPMRPGIRNRSMSSGPTSTTAAATSSCHSVPCGELRLKTFIEPPRLLVTREDDGNLVRVSDEDRVEPLLLQLVDRPVGHQPLQPFVDCLEILRTRREDADDLLDLV